MKVVIRNLVPRPHCGRGKGTGCGVVFGRKTKEAGRGQVLITLRGSSSIDGWEENELLENSTLRRST